MLIKVQTWIYIEVDDVIQAEAACMVLEGLEGIIGPTFPEGEVVDVDIAHYEKVNKAEAERRGLVE